MSMIPTHANRRTVDFDAGKPTWSCVRVPAQFAIENRRVFATPVAAMTFKQKADSYPRMARAVKGLLAHHPEERVLIHTVSYDLGKFLLRDLMANLGPSHKRLMTYDTAKDRDKVIERYRRTEGAVLIAPSLERGVDFKGDDCRVVAVCKIPFPNISDRQISARLHSRGGQMWYSVATVRSLVQMTGRATRSAEDHSVNYILDEQFVSNVWKKSKHLLPSWWREAVDMSGQFVRVFQRLAESRAA